MWMFSRFCFVVGWGFGLMAHRRKWTFTATGEYIHARCAERRQESAAPLNHPLG